MADIIDFKPRNTADRAPPPRKTAEVITLPVVRIERAQDEGVHGDGETGPWFFTMLFNQPGPGQRNYTAETFEVDPAWPSQGSLAEFKRRQADALDSISVALRQEAEALEPSPWGAVLATAIIWAGGHLRLWTDHTIQYEAGRAWCARRFLAVSELAKEPVE